MSLQSDSILTANFQVIFWKIMEIFWDDIFQTQHYQSLRCWRLQCAIPLEGKALRYGTWSGSYCDLRAFGKPLAGTSQGLWAVPLSVQCSLSGDSDPVFTGVHHWWRCPHQELQWMLWSCRGEGFGWWYLLSFWDSRGEGFGWGNLHSKGQGLGLVRPTDDGLRRAETLFSNQNSPKTFKNIENHWKIFSQIDGRDRLG